MVQPRQKTVWRLLRKLEIPSDPAIPPLDIYLEKTIVEKNMCTAVFLAALLH